LNWFKRDKPKEEKSTDKELPQNEEIKLEVEQFHEEQIDNSQYKNGSEELENEIESKKTTS